MNSKSPVTSTDRKRHVRRFLKRDKEGVASTVGTIMALLVFLTFLTLFTNSYVPVWMIDNERTHMNTVMDQFGELKGKVDNLVVNAEITGTSNLNMYAPVTLGAAGIPVFAAPTLGQLTYGPSDSRNASIRVQFQYNITGGSAPYQVDNLGGGMVQLYAPNRYYVQQWLAYENGALIIKQEDGQVMRAFPSLSLDHVGSPSSYSVNVNWTQIDFVGSNATVAGTGTAGLNLDLFYLDQQIYSSHAGNGSSQKMVVTMTITTNYGNAWWQYLTDTVTSSNLVNHTDYQLTHDLKYSMITLKLMTVGSLTYNRAFVDVTVQM
jgi:hypothetical protein